MEREKATKLADKIVAAEEQLQIDDEYEILMQPVKDLFPGLQQTEEDAATHGDLDRKQVLSDKAEMWYKKLVSGEQHKESSKHKKHVVKISTESYSVPEPRLTEKQRLFDLFIK